MYVGAHNEKLHAVVSTHNVRLLTLVHYGTESIAREQAKRSYAAGVPLNSWSQVIRTCSYKISFGHPISQ